MAKKAKTPTIETALEQIETTIQALDEGDLDLDQALAKYEAALGLVRQADQLLAGYSARLEELGSAHAQALATNSDAAAEADDDDDDEDTDPVFG